MKKYFVIGNPITHSLSPELHNFWFNINKIEAIYKASKTFIILNRLSRDLPISPSTNDISRIIPQKISSKNLRKIKNLILDLRLHRSNFIQEDKQILETKEIKLELSGVSIEIEESKESLLAAIKLLESRLDLFRV